MKALPDFERLLAPLREEARSQPREALPGLCGALAAFQAELLLLPASAPPAAPDRLLSPEEVGRRLGRSRDWCYRHRGELPRTQLASGRWGVSEARLERWLAQARRSSTRIPPAPSGPGGATQN